MPALAVVLALVVIAPPEVRRTREDLRSLAAAAEAYFSDHRAYPKAKTMEELKAQLSPGYLKTVPMTDAWGTPFMYRSSRGHYRFVSAGPDRKFDPTSLVLGKRPAKSDDIISADIELIRP